MRGGGFKSTCVDCMYSNVFLGVSGNPSNVCPAAVVTAAPPLNALFYGECSHSS